MKTNVFQAITSALIVYFLALMAGLIPSVSFADNGSQTLTIQNVTLQPGDVINFEGGVATHLGPNDTYGHTGMYLGIVDGQKKFMDFTTTKNKKTNDPYRGRISSAEQFLSDNTGHKTFYVYRLNGAYTVSPERLVAKAKYIAEHQTWGVNADCASAAASALSAATGKDIKTFRPDAYADSHQFDPVSLPIKIGTALNELKGIPDNGLINGTWSGTALSSESQRFGVTLHIQNVTGGTGNFEGCGGTLSGGSSGGNLYVYRLNITFGRRTKVDESGCVDGTIQLTLRDSGKEADYRWNGSDVDGTPMFSEGVLHKTR